MIKANVTRELFVGILLGFVLGVLFLVCFDEVNNSKTQVHFGYKSYIQPIVANKFRWLQKTTLKDENNRDINDATEDIAEESNSASVFNDMHKVYSRKRDEKARELATTVRILCWVMTMPNNIATKAKAVQDTWGKRCNILLFMSSKNDTKMTNVIGLDVPEGRENLTLKTTAAFKYVYENHYDDADWFIKADDDTFVILENLRYFLSQYNSSDRHYFGHYFAPFGGYNSGGAGYVFSKETLKEFYGLMNDTTKCKFKTGLEDVEVGQCLSKVDIHPADTRDGLGRKTFHPFDIKYHIDPKGKVKELSGYDKWEVKIARECCSDYSITYHYINPNQMYEMNYLIYYLRTYGIES